MINEQWKARKVVIVGAGAVGSTFAYALAQHGVSDEIVLTDINRDLVKGQVLDLTHGIPFFPSVNIREGSSRDFADANVIVITAGATMNTSGESRLDLLKNNKVIIDTIIDEIVSKDSQAVIVVVSNPVDVLTYIAHRRSGWPRGRIFGSGTVLDSARFRHLLSERCSVDVHNVHAYILGEHGDSEFVAWSMTHIAGIAIDEYCQICKMCSDWKAEHRAIEESVRSSAYHIIEYKGATNFAVGLSLVRIVSAILRNEKSVLTVSIVLEGEYGLSDVSLSVPCIISQSGVERILEANLSSEEMKALSRSAKSIS